MAWQPENKSAAILPRSYFAIKLQTLKTLGFVGVAWALVVFECGFRRGGFSHRQRLFRIGKRIAGMVDGWRSAISLLVLA